MRKGPQAVRYALQMYSADDQLINGTTSTLDLEGTRRLAQGTLRLVPSVAYIAIHQWESTGRMAPQPLAQVDWDQEW